MDQIPMLLFILLLLSCLFPRHPLALTPPPSLPSNPTSHITVVGAVYCDVCYSNTFSTHSYFLPGVDVNVGCKFKDNSPGTTEQINLSVNRTTDRYGVYKLEIPYVDGVDCVEGPAIEALCKATLIGTSSFSPACSVEGLKTTSNEITVKSRQDNHCIYSLSALSYRPSERNLTLCGNKVVEEIPNYLNSSKFFLPYFPPYGLFWPPLPQLPPFPPFPSFPFPPLPPLPKLPPLPFPFPPLPPFPQTPPPQFSPPSPPAFNLGDPRTWIPNFPSPPANFLPSPQPPPPPVNIGNPRTWIPNFPFLSPPPPPPPPFTLTDPKTWIPVNPPTPPNNNPLKQDP